MSKESKHFYTIGVLCSHRNVVVVLIVRGVFYDGIVRGKVIGCFSKEVCDAHKGCFINHSIATYLNRDREDFKRLM